MLLGLCATAVACSISIDGAVATAAAAPCDTALAAACPSAWWASVAACTVCAQQSAARLEAAGCTNDTVHSYCAALAATPPQLSRSSNGQLAALRRARQLALPASAAALPAVEAMLDSAATRGVTVQSID